MISGVGSPGLVSAPQESLSRTFASLSYSGIDPVITGSVRQLFNTGSFAGPNRSSKTDRILPDVSVMEIARSFLEIRTQLVAVDSGTIAPELLAEQALPDLPGFTPVEGAPLSDAPRIALASIGPPAASAALAAIEQVIPQTAPLDPSIPFPTLLPDQLAYVRANTPTTERAVNRYSEREQWCLSTAIYFEARGESYRGQVGVAQVVMNRVKHRLYPDTICGVVFQNQSWRNRCQFSFACDGIPERVNDAVAWAQAKEITEKVTRGDLYLPEVANATHYHATYVNPYWASRMKRVTQIGRHIFYRFRS